MNYVRPTQLLSLSLRTLSVKFSYAMVWSLHSNTWVTTDIIISETLRLLKSTKSSGSESQDSESA